MTEQKSSTTELIGKMIGSEDHEGQLIEKFVEAVKSGKIQIHWGARALSVSSGPLRETGTVEVFLQDNPEMAENELRNGLMLEALNRLG